MVVKRSSETRRSGCENKCPPHRTTDAQIEGMCSCSIQCPPFSSALGSDSALGSAIQPPAHQGARYTCSPTHTWTAQVVSGNFNILRETWGPVIFLIVLTPYPLQGPYSYFLTSFGRPLRNPCPSPFHRDEQSSIRWRPQDLWVSCFYKSMPLGSVSSGQAWQSWPLAPSFG